MLGWYVDDELDIDILCVGGAPNSALQVEFIIEFGGLVASAPVVAVCKEGAQALLGKIVKETIVIEVAYFCLLLDDAVLHKVERADGGDLADSG